MNLLSTDFVIVHLLAHNDPTLAIFHSVLPGCLLASGSKQINNINSRWMLIKRRITRRQPIHLPSINPQLNPPKSYQTLDAINFSTIEDGSHSPAWYMGMFKQFERDFNNNRLETEFDRMLDETLHTRNNGEMSDMPQQQFIKQVSKQIKMKLFHEYAKKRKQQPSCLKKTLKQRGASLHEKSKSRLEISTLSVEKLKEQRSLEKIVSNRIFSIRSTFNQLQQKSKRGLSRRLRNYRLYPQLVNPLLFVNI